MKQGFPLPTHSFAYSRYETKGRKLIVSLFMSVGEIVTTVLCQPAMSSWHSLLPACSGLHCLCDPQLVASLRLKRSESVNTVHTCFSVSHLKGCLRKPNRRMDPFSCHKTRINKIFYLKLPHAVICMKYILFKSFHSKNTIAYNFSNYCVLFHCLCPKVQIKLFLNQSVQIRCEKRNRILKHDKYWVCTKSFL